MKKSISLFIFLFVINFSMQAQEAKVENQDNIEVQAKKDTKALVSYLNLEGIIKEDLYRLFVHKYKVLAEEAGEEQKIVLSKIITKKIEATLSADQMAKLSQNKELLQKLTH